jgi:glyoxylase-like metal-dependent hydrolase (beta-lactamase superfamily II)/rhodanese-related sulfurtransferase
MDAVDGLPQVSSIDAATLVRWLGDGTPVTVLDVRPAAERAGWSIPGSVHVDAYDALWARDPAALAGAPVPRDRPVVAVCAAGRTSRLAAALLHAQGHDAYSLDRGMRAWSLAWNHAEVALAHPDDPGASRIIQVRRVGKGCLSYLVVSAGEALVIDPCLDASAYLSLASDLGSRVGAVVETHVHADHLSRGRALAAAAGARLFIPEQGRTRFSHEAVRDGDRIPVGTETVLALRTPGHTGESTCYSFADAVLFTGDTLAAGGVGRPDLEAGREEAEPRARALYRSLLRILDLPAPTLVLPGHTGEPVPLDGSPVMLTLGEARARIRLLSLDEEDFTRAVVSSLPALPPNHAAIIGFNEEGTSPAGDPAVLEAGANRCAVG